MKRKEPAVFDDRNYTVTWLPGGDGCRRTNLSLKDAQEYAKKIELDWKICGCRGTAGAKIWYFWKEIEKEG